MADKKISALTAASTPLAGTEVLPIVQGGSTVKVSAANITAGRAVAAASLAATDFVSATNYVVAGTGTNIALLQPKNIGFYNAGVAEGTITCSDDSSAFVSIGLTKTTARFTTGNVDRLSINAAGNVTVNTGNVIVGTAGKGIDFSANPNAPGMTSELLNDYEEGTFTPTIEGSTTPGTTTYTIQRGSYTKVGRLVTCSFTIQWSATTAAGNLKIFGLPFTNTTPNGDGGFFIANGSATGATGYVGAVQTGGTFIFVYSTVAATDYVFSTFQYFG